MGVNHGSAVLSGIKRLAKNTAKSLDLKALEFMANRFRRFGLKCSKSIFAANLHWAGCVISDRIATAKMFPFRELPMESVRTGLRQIMSDLLRARPAEEAVVLAWPLVCGKEVATRTQAVSFANGTLTVQVADVSWRNQLQSFVPKYLSGYEGLLGQVVKSIRLE
jgi:hypothetical protein